jgi:MFS family permease
LVDSYGENKVLRIMDFLAIVAILMQLVTIHTAVLCVSRFLMGLFCGITSGLVPAYIISISPSFTSGILGTFNQVAMAVGMAFAYYMGQFLDNNQLSDEAALRWLIGIPLTCLLVHIAILFLFPYDTLERHILRRENLKVRGFLKMVYGPNWKAFEREIREHKIIPVEIEAASKSTRDVYEEENFEAQEQRCKCKKLNFHLLSIMLAAATQLSGVNAVLEYAKQLFLVVEEGDEAEADMSVLFLGIFQVFATFLSGFLINHFGRRPLMLTGLGIIIVSLFTGVLVTFLVPSHESITVVIIFAHILGFSISLGPICMLYAVEALESLRLLIVTYWGMNLLITLFSDFLIESVGVSFMFLIFGVCSLFSFGFLYVFMVETKDTPRKKVWEAIEGSKMEWEKSVLAFSLSTANKKDENVEKSHAAV